MNKRRIIPISITPVKLEVLLSSIVYIDIVDKSEDDEKNEIINGVSECFSRMQKKVSFILQY